jgi:hypothetical protein
MCTLTKQLVWVVEHIESFMQWAWNVAIYSGNFDRLWERCMGLVWQGVCPIVALAFTLQSILSQKKNYGNSNISACKKI